MLRWGVALLAGDVLGRYEIVRLLGRGGMAEVYVAKMRGIGGFVKEVALKCVLPELLAEAELTQMFLDEARTSARLEHPNIVQVFDIGQETGHLYFAMEYVRGSDVRALLGRAETDRAPVALGAALAVASGTAAASHHAHELGVIHRDISPSNILISSAGTVKLTDFGIAKATSNRNVTQSGVVKGKLGYMSPEQCRGKVLDRRSDIYSLGILMYQLTTGRLPFAETNPLAFAEEVLRRDPVPPSQLVAGYPSKLEQIVMRAIERSPDARYRTAAELQHDLSVVVRELGIDASPAVLAACVASAPVDISAPLSPSFVTASLDAPADPLTDNSPTVPSTPLARDLVTPRKRRWPIGLAIAATAVAGGFIVHRVMRTSSHGAPAMTIMPQPSSSDHTPAAPPPAEATETAVRDMPPAEPATTRPESSERAAQAMPTTASAPSKRESTRRSSVRPKTKQVKNEPSGSGLSNDPDAPLPGSWRPQ
jgi:eukaryotic-like serine/threonine-protein kinase